MAFVRVTHRNYKDGDDEGKVMDVGLAHVVFVAAEPVAITGLFEVRLTNTTIYVDAADRQRILDAKG